MYLEFCAENFTKVPKAIAHGADRIELCDNLTAGGTTPSYAVIEQTIKYAKENNATVMTMIRPRGGNFVYSNPEFQMMKQDLHIAKQLKSDGIVFGCLTKESRIDREQTKALLDLSGDMETVFHMAFDEIPRAFAKEDLDFLMDHGVTRILTHGGRTGTVLDNQEWLQEIIDYADGRIEILIGGGVTHENVDELASLLSTEQFHGTRIVEISE